MTSNIEGGALASLESMGDAVVVARWFASCRQARQRKGGTSSRHLAHGRDVARGLRHLSCDGTARIASVLVMRRCRESKLAWFPLNCRGGAERECCDYMVPVFRWGEARLDVCRRVV